jgi:hypothetical protein
MPYVVKTIFTNGTAAWLHTPDPGGIRSASIRENAEIFPSLSDAGKAIAKMPVSFTNASPVFYIEDSDGNSPKSASA